MKIWETVRKTALFALILALALPFCGCTRDKRFDYTELDLRLEELAPQFAFRCEDLFFADGVYYCYYSLGAPNDALLTAKEDADGRLDRITLTLAAPPTDPRFADFRAFALALAEIFIPEADTAAICEKTKLDAPAAMLEQTLGCCRSGFYSAAAFAAPEATCFILQYSTLYEK